MSSGRFILFAFALLGVLSIVAYLWRPKADIGDKRRLVWASDNNPARAEQIAAFNEEHPDLLLELDYGNAGSEKIVLQASSGVGPDIFDSVSTQLLQMYAEAGIAWDVTDAAREMGFSATNDTWSAVTGLISYQGRQYAFPANTWSDILIFNKNIFDHFGVAYPTDLMTWDEFVEMARKVNSASRGSNEKIFSVTGLSWRTVFAAMQGEFFTPSGDPYIENNGDLAKAIEMHKQFLSQHRIMPSGLELASLSGQGGWGTGNLNQFSAGRFAMIQTGVWSLISLGRAYQNQIEAPESRRDPGDLLDRPLRLGAVLLPKFPDRPPAYLVSSRTASINAHSPRREEALKFLKFLSGPTYSRLLNKSADALPGNPEFADLGVESGSPDLAREEMHRKTKEAVKFGYAPRSSPYVLSLEVERILNAQVGRMEANPAIEVSALLRTAQRELEKMIQGNLARNPSLQRQYEARNQAGAPAAQ